MPHGSVFQLFIVWREDIAAVLAVLYVLLVIWQWPACWVAGFLSSCLYVWVMYEAHLYMEAWLNVFYALMAVYGYWQWRGGSGDETLPVTRWTFRPQLLGLAAVVLVSLLTSYFLREYTTAAWPFVDSLITWASVYATYLVARKVYENWYWWLVIDSVALLLYYSRQLYPTMLLYGLYLVLIGFGMRSWHRDLIASRHGI